MASKMYISLLGVKCLHQSYAGIWGRIPSVNNSVDINNGYPILLYWLEQVHCSYPIAHGICMLKYFRKNQGNTRMIRRKSNTFLQLLIQGRYLKLIKKFRYPCLLLYQKFDTCTTMFVLRGLILTPYHIEVKSSK